MRLLPHAADWLHVDTTGDTPRDPYESPMGRRVNALVAYNPFATKGALRFLVRPRTLTSADVLTLLRRLPTGTQPCVVILDNAGIHTSSAIRQARPALRRHGLRIVYLPAYSPDLNEVEPIFGAIKRYELPERSYATTESLLAAVRTAFRRYAARRRQKSEQHLRPDA